MVTYATPQAEVFQDFVQAASVQDTPLRASIFGPHAFLLRYTDADEKPTGTLGDYDPSQETCYAWPHRPAGGLVDQDYTKLFLEDALLRYWHDDIGAGDTLTRVSGTANRIRAAATNFADNGDSYPRDTDLLRDVLPGDIVKVRGVESATNYLLSSYVKSVVGDAVAAIVGAASSDDANAATAAASATIHKTDGADNCVFLTEADASGYDGLADGDVVETYTVRVTQSSVDGDFTTATLQVLSASGHDDVAEVTPSAEGAWTDIGTRGLQVLFEDIPGSLDCATDADDAGVSADDLVAGQEWTVSVVQAFTAPVATAGGTYTGDTDTTYIVTISRGGDAAATAAADRPQIMVSTTTGVDVSGPTTLAQDPDAIPATLAVAVGHEGITILWDRSLLSKNDRYYVEATAAAEGPMRTLVLGHSLPDGILDDTDLEVQLFIKKNFEVERNRTGSAPLTNFSTSATEICVADGIVGYDDSWADSGVPQPLDVTTGSLFVHYRAWRSGSDTVVGSFGKITDIGELDSHLLGATVPDNPLKYGVAKALENNNGTEVVYSAVADPDDLDSWEALLNALTRNRDVYGMVPLSADTAVLAAFAGHAGSMSSPAVNYYRVLWATASDHQTAAVVDATTSTDSAVVLATLEDDPDTSGSQYNLLSVPAANGQFLTNGVRAGDVVRTLYTDDGFGNATYSSFTIDRVISEDQLLLLSGPDAPLSVAQKVEVWRTRTATEEAAAIAAECAAYGNRRVRFLWAETCEMDGEEVPLYFLACTQAALRGGILPHKSMTRLATVGADRVIPAQSRFDRAALDTMATAGVYVMTQTPDDATIHCRHALTSVGYAAAVTLHEEAIQSNVDHLSFQIFDTTDFYVGKSNVTETFFGFLRSELETWVTTKVDDVTDKLLGPQLREGSKVLEVRPHATIADRVYVSINAIVPAPTNNIETHLQLSVSLVDATAAA